MQPPKAGVNVTNRITTALKAISINIMDHIIAAGDKYYSFAEQGLIENN